MTTQSHFVGWKGQWAAWNPRFSRVYIGDFNGGGISDLLTIDPAGGAAIRQAVVSQGNFVHWMNRWAAWTSKFSQVQVGDFNGDGVDDILTREPLTGSAIRQAVLSQGNFSHWKTSWAGKWPSTHPIVYVGDFNGDGADDLLTVNPPGGAVVKQSIIQDGNWSGWKNTQADW